MVLILALSVLLRVPNPKVTPGATRPVTAAEVCRPGSAKAARNVPSALKRRVFAAYGIIPKPGQFEVDHLISLELGGSNAFENLWPQPFFGSPNAHDKDRLENKLHQLVCSGKVSLPVAQRAIATDWLKALKDYGGVAGPR